MTDPPPAAARRAPDQRRTSSSAGRPRWRFAVPAGVIGLAMIGSLGFIAYDVAAIEDDQIPLLAAGFAVLGASFAAIAAWSVLGMWRAASRAAGGRALALAIVGGLAGIGAIGCFAVTALAALVWTS